MGPIGHVHDLFMHSKSNAFVDGRLSRIKDRALHTYIHTLLLASLWRWGNTSIRVMDPHRGAMWSKDVHDEGKMRRTSMTCIGIPSYG